MGKPVESAQPPQPHPAGGLEIRVLGPLRVLRDGAALPLPPSRKARALIGYLALASGAVSRSQICELLWDVPNDPRGELRWCLSKIRAIFDEPGLRRIHTRNGTVHLDLAQCFVDAGEIVRAMEQGVETLVPQRQRALAALFAGDLLQGLELDRCPAFDAWLAAQRRRLRAGQTALLERMVRNSPDQEALPLLEKLLELSPFDRHSHARLLTALASRDRIREGEEHLAATTRLFEAEGLDASPIREAWNAARALADGSQISAVTSKVAEPVKAGADRAPGAARRASIAIMPFADRSVATRPRGGIGDAIVHDLITRLAKLRSLFVIAQGTVFALDERRVDPEEAGRILDVDYTLGGSVERAGNRVTIGVKLTETRTGRVIWAEVLTPKFDDALVVLDEIGNRIVASVDSEIEAVERNRAILKPPNSLDAWEAHHRGLWHMYRFSRADNDLARHFFEIAVHLDPTFSRAHAGLSFTHWQDAFQGWAERDRATESAYAAAGESLMADDRDPAGHWAMGRAMWLRGLHDQAVSELTHSVDLSPNFALAHYNLAFVHSTAGDAGAAIGFSDHSRSLSPFDPMLFAMFGARAIALVRLGRFAEAAEWAVKAAARPNAHSHIRAVAAFALALAGRSEEGRGHMVAIRANLPNYRFAEFQNAFQLDAEGAAQFRKGARLVGLV